MSLPAGKNLPLSGWPYLREGAIISQMQMTTYRPNDQRPRHPAPPLSASPVKRRHGFAKFLLAVVVAALLIVGATETLSDHAKPPAAGDFAATQQTTGSRSATATADSKPNECASNTLSKLILVSISQQHLWACAGTTESYNSAVVTGMELYPADLTPTGTYHIYAKYTGTTLTGHDSTGSWSDPVSYWMPFLRNQYGQYGFHDATWRSPSDFGNININAPYTAAEHGSHGCVELPLATAKWLYDWAPVGTTVTVAS